MALKWAVIFANFVACFESTLRASFLENAPADGCAAPDVIGRCTRKTQTDLVFLVDTADPTDNLANGMFLFETRPRIFYKISVLNVS